MYDAAKTAGRDSVAGTDSSETAGTTLLEAQVWFQGAYVDGFFDASSQPVGISVQYFHFVKGDMMVWSSLEV